MTFTQGINSIIPAPSRIRSKSGRFELKPQIEISIYEKELSPLALRFAEDLAVVTRKAASATISDDRKTDSASISLRINRKLEQEEYALDISPDSIKLVGGSSLGVAWGLSTLRQNSGQTLHYQLQNIKKMRRTENMAGSCVCASGAESTFVF